MDNFDDQALFSGSNELEQVFSDYEIPWEYAMNTCSVPSYAEQPQIFLSNAHLFPLSAPATTEGFAVSTGHLPYGGLQAPTTTGTVNFSVASNPGPCQSHWSGMSSSLTPETCASVPQLQNQYQFPHELICGWSRDLEPPPVPYSIPQSKHPTLTSYSSEGQGQYDPWVYHVLGEGVDPCPSSPDGDTALSASGFLRDFADYDCPSNAYADTPIPLTHNAMPSVQSTALPCSEPVCGPNPSHQTRNFECHWLTNGARCEVFVMADRRSIMEHLQRVHGIQTGDEKARKTCLWEGCRTTLNKESLGRHILAVHLKEGVRCAECGLLFAREDSLKRHQRGGQHKVPSGKRAARQPPRNHAGFQ